jgi:L-histidine Nalpha-methyltransferase
VVDLQVVLTAQIGENQCMPSFAKVLIHASQFPEKVRCDLLASLRARCVNHKFHYDSVKQTRKWLALHQAYSPTRNDADCRAIYEYGFKAAAAQIKAKSVHVIGLGCGGGQKDTRLLKLLKAHGREIFYTPCDVSTAMVLTARQTALAIVPEKNCFPFVCDLATADDLEKVVGSARCADRTPQRGIPANSSRLLTFFGMIPNFEPQIILPKLASLIRPKDFLLVSANLAPGKNYTAGVKKVLPQYDNPLTRDWLMMFLLDLGVEPDDGKLRFKIEADRTNDLKRIVADFHFTRARRIEVDGERIDFRAGETIRLFFSYRYTPERVRKVLGRYGLEVCEQWIAKSGEECVFLCWRK